MKSKEKLRFPSLKKRRQHMSYTDKMENNTSTHSPAGKKQGGRGKSLNILHTIDTCTLDIYIDAVCNNKLSRLIVSGNPTEEELIRAKIAISGEFAVLSENQEAISHLSTMSQMYKASLELTVLRLAFKLIKAGEIETAAEELKKIGVKTTDLNRIRTQVEKKHLRLLELNRANSKKEDSKKITSKYFSDLLMRVSKYMGFQVTRNVLLVDMASYIKGMNEQIKQMEQWQHRK